MDALVSRALLIRLSLQPSPASETSAFNKIRAFSSRCAGLFPFRISASSRSRSSPLSRTTYFFTEISSAAMIASITRVATPANHEILSNWLKRATRREVRASTPSKPGRSRSSPRLERRASAVALPDGGGRQLIRRKQQDAPPCLPQESSGVRRQRVL